jgi:hypothetical protein
VSKAPRSLLAAIRQTWSAFIAASPTVFAAAALAAVAVGVELVLAFLTWLTGPHTPGHLHATINVALGLQSPYDPLNGLHENFAVPLAFWSVILVPAIIGLLVAIGVAAHVQNRR